MNTARTLERPRLSVRAQALATLAAIVAAVALPQIFHVLGAVSGHGTLPGTAFLPMHLPIILVGLWAGPYAGAISGALGPVASFTLSGMPGIAILPLMMVELAVYGLCAGLLRSTKMPTIAKVALVQVAGRAAYALAILAAVNVFGSQSASLSAFFSSIAAGLPGLALQWLLLPLMVFRLENIKNEG